MAMTLMIFVVLISSGVSTENFDFHISAHLGEELILTLPEHLRGRIQEVLWKRGTELIATGFANETLYIVSPEFIDALSSSDNGSLIIEPLYWKGGEEYSADVTLTDKTVSSIHYLVSFQRWYIQDENGPRNVYGTAGEDLILPLERGIIENTEIKEIDWLTERWVYFAETKVGGNIRIVEDIFVESFSSSPNGSLIFIKATRNDQGIYRACIYSNKGVVFEQLYQVHVTDSTAEKYITEFTWRNHYHLIFISVIFSLCVTLLSFVIHLRRRRKAIQTLSVLEAQNELQCLRIPSASTCV